MAYEWLKMISILFVFTVLLIYSQFELSSSSIFIKRPSWLDASKNRDEKRLLAGRLWCVHNGNQLGNRIFEILGLEAIAKKLDRKPSLLLRSDPFNEPSLENLWKTIELFPNLLEDFYLEVDRADFNITKLPKVALEGGKPTKYHDLSELEALDQESAIIMEADLLQNYRYLEELGWSKVTYRLGFSKSIVEMVKLLVSYEFHQAKNRICVHMRRTDFHESSARISTTIKALKFLIKHEKCLSKDDNWNQFTVDDYGITIFSDDPDYVAEKSRSADYLEFVNRTWLPREGHPSHLVWAFLSNHCSHIVLTKIESTFGFIGAYLAGPKTQVYYSQDKKGSLSYQVPTPPNWIPIID